MYIGLMEFFMYFHELIQEAFYQNKRVAKVYFCNSLDYFFIKIEIVHLRSAEVCVLWVRLEIHFWNSRIFFYFSLQCNSTPWGVQSSPKKLMPLSVNMKSRNFPVWTPKEHLEGFSLISYFLIGCMTSFRSFAWLHPLTVLTIMSST